MNDKSSHDDGTKVHTTTVHASKGGGAGKWLLGGLAAVLLVGGGYLVWKNQTPGQTPETQTAYNDNYASDPVHASPLPGDPSANTQPSTTSESESASTPAVTQPASTTRRATTRTRAVPQETIGITPISATTEDEGVIVNGSRQPVWTRMPNQRRLSALYPVVAQEQGREGEAQLHCTVLDNGALNCARISETRGFGNAALRVANTLRHSQQFADGSNAIGQPVDLRVVFRLPPEERRG